MAEVDLIIAGRTYQVACRSGEEEALQEAGRLVDAKSREALYGLGTLSESRQLLFASLLLADQLLDKGGGAPPPQVAPLPDPAITQRVGRLAERLEALAEALEKQAAEA